MSTTTLARTVATLDDRYTATTGDVMLSGIQALVRTLLDQRRLDETRGLNTGLFLSGYQGSPLGGIDREVLRTSTMMESAGVVFRPGLNEELAATAVAGTQLIGELGKRTVDGITGVWFGKNPGFDRAADALRHGNISGTNPLGGAVAWIGDDPSSKSSTVPSSCEPMCRSLMMPLLAPGSVEEILSFGLHAIALSRHAGLWAGLKIVADVADSTSVVSVDGLLESIPDLQRARAFAPPTLLPPTNLDAEFDLMTQRLARASEYAEAAGLNRIAYDPPAARTAIVAAGLSFQSVLLALRDLGVTEADLAAHGIRLVQLGMPWPLEPVATRRLVEGVERILVVEDKLPFLEGLFKEILYRVPNPPLVLGKYDEHGAPLLTSRSQLLSDDIVGALTRAVPGLGSAAFRVPAPRRRTRHLELLPSRTPAFCSGCPHSVSTRAEGDQLVGVGIGCHVMVALEPTVTGGPKRGQLVGLTQMGGEGTQWIGLEPFTDDRHFFQNVGDGTFYHSASLAIRAAVAAGSTITYKMLFNDAVAMTGGQHPSGQMDIPALTKWLALEGVRRIAITSAHPETWRRTRFAPGVSVHHRDQIPELQRRLADEPGVTVLLHIDRCATEERRLRKRGRAVAPKERIWINERVCEGCGDCGDKSTCLSVVPVDTEFGRKTHIHQSSCNQDFSCLAGDCPSFVRVTPSGKPRLVPVPDVELPKPQARVGSELLVRMPGIGGTGVVTVSAVLQMAAFLDGRYAAGVEQIGLAQKGGPVISDIRFSDSPVTGQLRAGRGTVDVLLALDPIGGATDEMLDTLRPGALAVVNTGEVATSAMVQDTTVTMPAPTELRSRIDSATLAPENVYVDADALAMRHFADHMPTNMIVIGAALQQGLLPLSVEALEEAIRLNGASVENNLAALRLGRITIAAPEALRATALSDGSERPSGEGSRIERLADELTAWQDSTTAERFVADVREVADVDEKLGAAYADGLFKLTAYKDEYEVARLHLDSVERAKLSDQFGEDAKVKILLHPPVLRALGMKRKIALGGWFLPILRLLYALRGLRKTRLNPFGLGEVRRTEAALADEYRAVMRTALELDTRHRCTDLLLELADTPDLVRGYEEVKLRNVERYRARVGELMAQIEATASATPEATPPASTQIRNPA
ncbi:indolepyruvate ferredoxin oxidoreductase family protein [Nocardioides sp. Kera G14]|uniref:indolepyruvate ferredoxin oxidoreductase family protein n=1 Tax=Nocardioides sp. Kera G14 TaxID=2884264 RepID=UPI001D12F5C8|nr:indolepyruvate ferredoxin oxidoreductase family protein [Nocardioides sp. Kera G14]UDY23597.1 indolepyruvate ferredoxin oxidoreductase family protein [Nocardioides sp. Kera G14]